MSKPKLLFILNVAKRVNNFSESSMLAARSLGFDFHIAGNWSYESDLARQADEELYGIKIHQIDFIRAPYSPGNVKAYRQLKELVAREKYDFIHCNTPIGGVLGRIVGKKYKVKKVIYQVHGFHFYNGAPLLNWILYYPIEKLLSRITDTLITINKDDFEFAKKKIKLRRGGNVLYVPGVGIDTKEFSSNAEIRSLKRAELNISDDDLVLISSGNLDKNKNFETAIKAVALQKRKNVKLFICGSGSELENLTTLIENLGVEDRVKLLGYRSDMKELLCASDAFILPSFREGLSRSIMEAMASGLPCIVSKIRGNVDLIDDGIGGFLCSPCDVTAFSEAIEQLAESMELREAMSRINLEKIKLFDLATATDEMTKIYSTLE